MSQQELFTGKKYQRREPWYVSYALPGFSTASPRNYYGRRTRIETCTTRSKYMKEQGAALVFVDQKRSPKEIFKNIQLIPAVAAMFRNRYWVTFYGQTAFVDNTPLLPAPYARETKRERPTHFGLQNGKHSFFWGAHELARQCNRIEQFSDCAFCRHASDLGECLEVNTIRWARKSSVPERNVRLTDKDLKDDSTRSPDDLTAVLKAQCRSGDLDFVSPGVLAGPFSTKLMYINEMDVSSIKESIEDHKNRSTDAHSTRRALLVCKSDCYFHGYCGMATKPYYGHPRKCQRGEAYNREGVPGPFSEYEVMEAARREVASWNPRPREEIAIIARAAGVTTKIFGREMIVCKMDSGLQNVEFIHERSKEKWTYSYEDAMQIVSAKYYSGGTYKGILFYPEHTPPMSDEDYLIYAELCQVDYVSTGGWGTRQPITYVEWKHQYSPKFEIGVRHNYYWSVDSIKRAGELADGWNCLSSVATPAQIKAVREEEGRATTSDKPL
jgi:hypothetical protein